MDRDKAYSKTRRLAAIHRLHWAVIAGGKPRGDGALDLAQERARRALRSVPVGSTPDGAA